jgi:hypothetical protein
MAGSNPQIGMRFLCPFAALACAGCTTTIIPPREPPDPVTIYLADYGRHATILLPRDEGLAEYGYGHWRWFALGDAWLAKGPIILLIPGQSTLARRELPPFESQEHLQAHLRALSLTPLDVSAGDAALLLSRLDTRFDARRAGMIHNPRHGLDFVPEPSAYWLGHNCNTEVARWLTSLGCEIRGPALTSDFRVVPPTPGEHEESAVHRRDHTPTPPPG